MFYVSAVMFKLCEFGLIIFRFGKLITAVSVSRGIVFYDAFEFGSVAEIFGSWREFSYGLIRYAEFW